MFNVGMRHPAWQKALKTSADPERVRQCLEKLGATSAAPFLAAAVTEQARILAALFSGSQVLAEQLQAHPEWLTASAFDPTFLSHPRQKQGLRRELSQILKPLLSSGQYALAFSQLRLLKQREMIRIAARDLARLSSAPEITREISDLADVCLESTTQLLRLQLEERFGKPYYRDADGSWQAAQCSVVGLGKLGGQELNYSSDIDVIFVYSEEGEVFRTPPEPTERDERRQTNHQFFTRLAEAFIAEVGRLSPEGSLFRIDLRLRPEGKAGPLVRSLPSYENYYAQWGQTWERMMLIKARPVAGDPVLAGEFLEMVQPFRYPRGLGERILREVAIMKGRIEAEVVKADELERNVKLGRGGIREIEFLVQGLQVLNAGRIPFLQDAQTLPALEKLVRYNLLTSDEGASLNRAYCFLRDLEHRLQMEANRQTHTIPTGKRERERIAALMGFAKLSDFEAALRRHTSAVRETFDRRLRAEAPVESQSFPTHFEDAEEEWKDLLRARSFRDPDKALRLLQSLVHGPGYIHVSSRTTDLAWEFLPRLLNLCPRRDLPVTSPREPDLESHPKTLSDPDRVLARLDSFVSTYGARATLFELWARNPSLFELLVLLFDRSEFLAEIAIHVPDLVDELEHSGRLRRSKTSEETLKDLRHGLHDPDQRLWIRRYHQAEFMRIGLRDILGLIDSEQNLIELTALAEACLRYALEVVLSATKRRLPPLAIIGLGKLGGEELTYGSDLDLLFVTDAKARDLPALQGIATKIMELLSSQTELGVAFNTDARLRPDGAKGLLVNTLQAYEEYYRQRAMLWEIQTLTRARPIAGHVDLGQRFQKLATTLTDFRHPSRPLAAYSATWKQDIARMRLRIEKERVSPGKEALAFKTGAGGLMDAEFAAQTLCLAGGWHEPNTVRALTKAQSEELLPSPEAGVLIENYRRLRRIECILRRWSYVGESELPDDPAPLYRVAVRCGFLNADNFMRAVKEYRRKIRQIYDHVMAE